MADLDPVAAGTLTAFQVEVARVFFSLPPSEGFVLAGGAALAAQRLTNRPTQDLDFFVGPRSSDIVRARDAFEAAAQQHGWQVRRVRDVDTFCRMVVCGPEELLVDLAVDSPPRLPPEVSVAGPTYADEELAGRKVVALFDRAEARDFVDVYVLAGRFDKEPLLRFAADVDPGFDRRVYAEMIGTIARFDSRDLPIASERVGDLRAFFAEWKAELR